MDLSSLPEAQQQQLQQLHQQFQQHQLQQQEAQQQQYQIHQQQQQQQIQQQDYASQSNEPTHYQTYDPYYSYYQYQNPPPLPQPQHPYYHHHHQHPDYAASNAYQQHQPTPPPPHDEAALAVHPPGVSVSTEQGYGQVQVQHQRNAYYPQQGAGEQQSSDRQPSTGLNPAVAAAVAALSQLTQFAGTMDAAERAMAGLPGREFHGKGGGGGYGPVMGLGPINLAPSAIHSPGSICEECKIFSCHAAHFLEKDGCGEEVEENEHCKSSLLVGQSSYRGRGRKGGGNSRRSKQENIGLHHSRPGGVVPPFHGKGRGRGQGRGRGSGGHKQFASHNASSSHSGPSATGAVELTEEEEPKQIGGEEIPQDAAAYVPAPEAAATSNKKAGQACWCELCRVDCTSMEILEQHKNGKKHKKNLQRLEELKKANQPGTGIQSGQKEVESNSVATVHPGNVQRDGENHQALPEGLGSGTNSEQQIELSDKNDTVKQAEIPQGHPSDSQARLPVKQADNRRGLKRKMKAGRGGKRVKSFEAVKRSVEPSKPKVVIPLICDLCNVKCDTQEVFERHLAGKKHIAKLKKYEDHQARYGPMGLQALYPPNPIARTVVSQGHQQTFYQSPASFPPPNPYILQQDHQAVPPFFAASDTQFYQHPNTQAHQALPTPFAASDAHFQKTPNPQASDPTVVSGSQFAPIVPETQQLSETAASETSHVNIKTKTLEGNSESQS